MATTDDVDAGMRGFPVVDVTKRQKAIRDPNCDREVTCNGTAIYRTADGTCNNVNNPLWGAAGIQHRRLIQNAYERGKPNIKWAAPCKNVSSGILGQQRPRSGCILQNL